MPVNKVILPLFFLLTSCATYQEKETKNEAGSWRSQMSHLAIKVAEIFSNTKSPESFNSFANDNRIKSNIFELKEAVKVLHKKKGPDQDPAISFAAKKLQNDLHQSLQIFSRGNKESARALLRQASNNCFGCHTRTNVGRMDNGFRWSNFKEALSASDLAHYYLNLREYKFGIKIVKDYLNDSNAKYTISWEDAIHKALVALVRVYDSPTETKRFVQLVGNNSNLKEVFRTRVKSWMQSIELWEKGFDFSSYDSPMKFKLALELAKRGRFSNDPSEYFVDNLRASKILADLFISDWNSPELAARFFLAGELAEKLKIVGLSGLEEVYFEQCLRKLPYSETAKLCFQKLKMVYEAPQYLDQNNVLKASFQSKLESLRSYGTVGGNLKGTGSVDDAFSED